MCQCCNVGCVVWLIRLDVMHNELGVEPGNEASLKMASYMMVTDWDSVQSWGVLVTNSCLIQWHDEGQLSQWQSI